MLLAVLVCVLAVGTWYFRKQRSEKVSATERQAETQQSETTDELERLLWNKIKLNGKKYKYSTDYETYLFMGTDGSGKEDADRDEYIGNMADFLMLVIVNRKEQTYAFLQLNRDQSDRTQWERDGHRRYAALYGTLVRRHTGRKLRKYSKSSLQDARRSQNQWLLCDQYGRYRKTEPCDRRSYRNHRQ